VANPTSGALNPGFDVTPAELITGIITPMGILKPRELWARRRRLGCASSDDQPCIKPGNSIRLSMGRSEFSEHSLLNGISLADA
jgi:hypothetical protein